MARPYSDDLRRKLLEAHDLGKGTLAELADQFGMAKLNQQLRAAKAGTAEALDQAIADLLPTDHRTQQHGSDFHSTLYSNS